MKTRQFKVVISDEAEIDLDNSFEYYFKDNPNVADVFYRIIDSSFLKIQQSPYLFPIVYENIRKYVVEKFPFVIYHQVDNKLIKVIAIFHTSRNPLIWNDRL